MAALTERNVRQRLLRSFIDYDPLIIDLTRPTMTVTAAGGVVQTGSVVVSGQKFYFVPFFRRLTDQIGKNPQSYGEDFQRSIMYTLIFMPDETDVKEGDLFTAPDVGFIQSGSYRVEFLSKRQWDRQQAVVKLRD